MGKKKKNGSGKAKAAKQPRGFKLPKEVRKAGAQLLTMANSPAGREMLAMGLSFAAGLAREAVERDRAPKHRNAAPHTGPEKLAHADRAAEERPTPKNHKPGNDSGSRKDGIDPHDIGAALGSVAQEMLGRFLAPKPKG